MDNNHEHAENTIVTARQVAETEESLVNRVTDARKALEISAKTYKEEWDRWAAFSATILPDIQMFRMAMDREMVTLMRDLGEVRKFFLTDTHEMEMKRLKEFVELCERLQGLQQSGFLDRVTDVMLKLEKANAC